MYEIFLEKNLNSIRQAVDDTFIAKYADLSYPELTTLWQEVGLGSYCDGMLKIINPPDYQEVLNSCYAMDYDKSFLPFMCTAFGDVFAYVKNPKLNNYIVYLNVRYGTYLILPDNLAALLNKIIFNRSFLKGWFDLEYYPTIQEKLGTPDFDECFGYSPLLAMGGSENLENIEIVKTLSYIDISTQTIGRFKRSDKL
uniref:T6SS immunity protein Tdi1 domain-containing protein n=1 Tax=Bacteroides caccae TaxID=47678 RepID=UPI00359C3416